MHQYQYQYGDRPLEGYTIQRAAGRGGFGEVYYAISDSGREVALKTVQNYEQIELRGIKQCMNLKNPHLVSVFDVKYNSQGRPFVVMEFVSGMSLRDILDESPQGVGTQKAAFFLREIAKGLSYLHECGIVHRDLKPGNIFYENGYVKIGDYGLTKAINHDQHSVQTVTVGTVHYMAPEIGEGKYDYSIDIYALGVLLYEMLTGQVPYFGASPGEILMKHLSSTPDLTGIEEPFARVIRKALDKDPGQRYQTVKEMVEGVFGAEHIQHSVSQFSPDSLSMVAERVAAKAQVTPPPISKPPASASDFSKLGEQIGRKIGSVGNEVARKVASVTERLQQGSSRTSDTTPDVMDQAQRHKLAFVTMAVIGLGIGVLDGGHLLGRGLPAFLVMASATIGLFFAQERLLYDMEAGLLRHWLAVAVAIICSSLVWGLFNLNSHMMTGTLFSLGALGLVNWWALTLPTRRDRISWGPAVGAGMAAFFISAIMDGSPLFSAGVVAGILIVIQVVSPFQCRSSVFAKRRKQSPQQNKPQKSSANAPLAAPLSDAPPAVAQGMAGPRSTTPQTSLLRQPMPPWLRPLLLICALISFGIGLFSLLVAGIGGGVSSDEFAVFVSTGVGGILTSIWFLPRLCCSTMISWYRFLIKPALLHLCLLTTITASIVVGNVHLQNEEEVFGIFMILFPMILFLVIFFLPSRNVEHLFTTRDPRSTTVRSQVSPRMKLWALLLALIFPFAGLHRIYVGKFFTGLLWFFTWGLFGIGQLIDIILILTDSFCDVQDRPLLHWLETPNTVSTPPIIPKPIPHSQEKNTKEESFPCTDSAVAAMPLRPDSSAQSAVIIQPRLPFRPFSALLAAFGYLLIVIAVVVACFSALHLPTLFALGGPEEVVNEFSQFFGDANWPRPVERITFGLALGVLVLAGVLVAVARRSVDSRHMLRAVLGIGILVIFLFPFCDMVPWQYFSDNGVRGLWSDGQISQAMDHMLNHVSKDALWWAGIHFVVAMTLLLWPPRMPKLPSVNTTEKGD